jgi:SagB-type dehydrogenase family enzyme
MRLPNCLPYYAAFAVAGISGQPGTSRPGNEPARPLPSPALAGPMSVEEAIRSRRSVREFTGAPLTLEEISQLCWAGQGITDPRLGLRSAPSAGGLYPIELYVVTAQGVNHYLPGGHKLERHLAGDLRQSLQGAALDQEAIGQSAACVVITAVVDRSTRKYGSRAERYCFIEAGHVAQNILLQAVSLGLGGVPIGACEDNQVAKLLQLPKGQRVLYILALGHPRNG